MSTRFRCPKCGGTDLLSVSVELVKWEQNYFGGVMSTEKITPIEMQSWMIYCKNYECDNKEGFPESDLDDMWEEIGENLDD